MDWDSAAKELGRALSRYNGLTNSANLGLIADITGDDMFREKPFVFAHKIREYFEDHNIKTRSAEVHLHHCIAFGLLYRALPGASFRSAKSSRKLESTSQIALTPLGRTCRAAVISGNTEFRNFILTYALLKADFDMYALLIKMAEENDGRVTNKDSFHKAFEMLLGKRLDWMREHFPLPAIRSQIQRSVVWIGRQQIVGDPARKPKPKYKRVFELDKIFRFDGETPAHHFRQRRKWAREPLGHLDTDGNLTDAGKQFAKLLPPVSSAPFFWLGPSEDCAKAQFISAAQIDPYQCSPAWRILRPNSELAGNMQDGMIDKVAGFMVSEFNNIRLGRFHQSSLDAVVPYLHFLECESGGKASKTADDFFRLLLKKHKDKLACVQQAKLSQSHFRLRKV